MTRPFKIAVTGTHSTGKSTFLKQLRSTLEQAGIKAASVHDSAADAWDRGLPILWDHTFESTSWLIGSAILLESAASVNAEVILVDRPVPDALGYLKAALDYTGRSIDAERMRRLEDICRAWSGEYDLVFLTVLDPDVPLGEGRDKDLAFRSLAGSAVKAVVDEMLPGRRLLGRADVAASLDTAVSAAKAHLGRL